jgi:beta-glucosidase
MCAYNSVDGAPACANTVLLQQKLKQDWHFGGYIVSDCAAITDVAVGHRFASDLPHAAAISLKAGTDLSCGKEYAALMDAVHQGLAHEADIDAAVKRLFTARFRLGMFDPPVDVPYNRIPFSENDCPSHAALALQAARASMVLLKNERRTLPLIGNLRSVAVIGPNASALPALEGNYNAVASHPTTPLAALEQRLPGHIFYSQGSPYVEGVPIPVPVTVFTTAADGSARPGLIAEYFDDPNLTGSPALSRVDSAIDFDWNGAAPVPGVSGRAFSIRWAGFLTPPSPGTLNFNFSLAHCSTCEDRESIRVWLDGKLVFDFQHAATRGRHAPTQPFTLTFADTHPHALRIEYAHEAPHFGAGLSFMWSPPAAFLRAEAVAAAEKSDVVIAFLGLSPEIEGEEMSLHVAGFDRGDRTSIELPDSQVSLVNALAATGKPLVFVLMNGSAIALGPTATKASAILEAWYPGESGGVAIADTLFGDNNPSGRLPITFYASTSQLPPFEDYSMKDRTYRYFTGQPLFPFGYGLSYASFKYSNGNLSTTDLKAGSSIEVSVDIRNTGDHDGDEVVELYLMPKGIVGAPVRALVGFERVTLGAGETRTVKLTIDARQLSFVSPIGNRSVRAGEYDLYVGGGQPSPDSGVFLPFRIQGSSLVAR